MFLFCMLFVRECCVCPFAPASFLQFLTASFSLSSFYEENAWDRSPPKGIPHIALPSFLLPSLRKTQIELPFFFRGSFVSPLFLYPEITLTFNFAGNIQRREHFARRKQNCSRSGIAAGFPFHPSPLKTFLFFLRNPAAQVSLGGT